MSNFELVEEYVTNRLKGSELAAFESQMASDPSLKAEVALQSQIINGLKSARAAELKAMLNNVPIGAAPVIQFTGWKIAAGFIGIALVASAFYFYYKKENGAIQLPKLSTSIEDSIKQQVEEKESAEAENLIPSEEKVDATSEKEASNKKNTVEEPAKNKASEVTRPAFDIVDPSADMDNTDQHEIRKEGVRNALVVSPIMVDVDSSNKKYDFHYQFAQEKLILYGSFGKGLYEILEINGEGKSVFLFYRENYYLLNSSNNEVSPLEEIRDKALLLKLKEYRGK